MQIDNSSIHAATLQAHREKHTERHQARTSSHLPPDTRPATSPYAAKPIPDPRGNQTQPGPKPDHPRTPDGRFAQEFSPRPHQTRTHRGKEVAHPVVEQP